MEWWHFGVGGFGSRRLGPRRLVLVWLIAVLLVALAPAPAFSDQTIRQIRCQLRVNAYAAQSHPDLPPEEFAARIAWLQSQCDQNADAELVAEPHGWTAPELFASVDFDRNATPIDCTDLSDERFGLTATPGDPGVDPNAPGGSPALNVPGDFMVAVIDGEAHLMMRTVAWAIDDRDGNVLDPVLIAMEVWYQGQGSSGVAQVPFAEAFVPRSVWVEVFDTLALGHGWAPALLPGRVTIVRTVNAASGCHDKRGPVVVPGMLLDRASFNGWLAGEAPWFTQTERYRFVALGDPLDPASWSLETTDATLPATINWTLGHPWFYDDEVVYAATSDPIDLLAPTADASHEPFAVFPSPTVTLGGPVADDSAVVAADVAIRDRVTGLFLQEDGSFGAKVWLAAALADPLTAATDWSWTADLPEGPYNVEVRAHDVAGRLGTMTVWRPFDVGVLDVTAPTVDADHDPFALFIGPSVTLTGQATDDVGVDRVELAIRDRNTGSWLQADGSFGAKVWHVSVLDTPGGVASGWSWTGDVVDGNFNVEVNAFDAAGNNAWMTTWRPFDVGVVDETPPWVDADHDPFSLFIGPSVTLTGQATDDVGVDRVELAIRDRNTGSWLQADGSFGAKVWHVSVLDTPGGVASGWSWTGDVVDGNFNVEVNAFDAAGNNAWMTTWRPFDVGVVDETPPWVDADHDPFTVFAGPNVILTGQATDDVGLDRVEVAVKERATGLWLQSDGSFGAKVWHVSVLDTPGGVASGWSWTGDMPDGGYNVEVKAFDGAGNNAWMTIWRPFDVT